MVTLCISTTMVLILLGMVVFSVLSARNLSAHMKEHLTMTIILKDSVTVNDAAICIIARIVATSTTSARNRLSVNR